MASKGKNARKTPVLSAEEREAALAERPAVQRRLFAWWDVAARDLPWRDLGEPDGEPTTPWGVLVSEVMSQQTQMSRVVPYWLAWMERWPDAAALAAAPKADVIEMWGRLGYPRRALRLQECARVVTDDYGDRLPNSYDELVGLPGIGDYTASAVISFAFHGRIAVIDTNIRRVLSRLFLGKESLGGSTTPVERSLAELLLPEDGGGSRNSSVGGQTGISVREDDRWHSAKDGQSGSSTAAEDSATDGRVNPSTRWNQTVMELGALVCTAKNPDCEHCPVADCCRFLAAGRPGLGERRTRPRQRFEGTDRQARGKILQALRNAVGGSDAATAAGDPDLAAAAGATDSATEAGGVVSYATFVELVPDGSQLDRCLASLDDDGLIELLPGKSARLPQ
ncbi:HhH-GPD family protein [Bifidobacterium choloepi]|nr:A/G-specific adenine glycosylase [Bifidobacterium choloepi]